MPIFQPPKSAFQRAVLCFLGTHQNVLTDMRQREQVEEALLTNITTWNQPGHPK